MILSCRATVEKHSPTLERQVQVQGVTEVLTDDFAAGAATR